MTLFAALTAKDGDASSSSSPPEAIQLYSNRVIDFLNGTTVRLVKNSSSKSGGGGEEQNKKEESSANNNNNAAANAAAGEGQSRYFSALSYQAIQTQQDDGPSLPNKKSSATAGQRHSRPDLGVWDCRINGDKTKASATLLKRVVVDQKKEQQKDASGEETADAADEGGDGPSPPIVMAVDLADLAEVQPLVERMRSVILDVYEFDEKANVASNNNPRVQCTTSIKALQSSTFGRTLIQEEVTVKGDSSSNEERIALILAVIVPPTIKAAASSSAAEEFKERQAHALLLYHLHKFSLEVNCTLCFVNEKGSTSSMDGTLGDGETKEAEASSAQNDPLLGRNTTMSIDELGKVIRRVAMGLSPVEHNDLIDQTSAEKKDEAKDETKEGDSDGSPLQRPPSIHVPGSHDAELIHGAYLRNASCEGQWDASKDDLHVALPSLTSKSAMETNQASKEEKTATGGGDEEWLSQLASSIGLSPDGAATTGASSGETMTPSAADRDEKRKQLKKSQSMKKRPARKSVAARNKDSKPKDEKEVMNFFDNLLKK